MKPAHSFWSAVSLSLIAIGMTRGAIAQTIPDGTLPSNSIVTPDGSTLTIDGGTAAGGNLFHSFTDFNVPTNDIAHFNNALTIDNIITRVTGGNMSNIYGTIRANGTANLFLINPAGLMFGPDASLDIGGSFVGSTAEALQFEDGSLYSAVDVDARPLLTINVPVGLQFGAEPGRIEVAGGGHNLRLTPPTGELAFDDRTQGLEVDSDRTLALVGGEVNLVGGRLKAPQGRIELGSVAGNSIVTLSPLEVGWQLEYNQVQGFQDIDLSNGALVDTSGDGAGGVQVQARSLSFSEGSTILALTFAGKPSDNVLLQTTESIEVTGTSDAQFPSGVIVRVQPGATGKSGVVDIQTEQLTLRNGAIVSVSTRGLGNAGSLNVDATNIELRGTSPRGFRSGFLAGTSPNSSGAGGNIRINTDRLLIFDGARISGDTAGMGDAGDVAIIANDIELRGMSVQEQDSRIVAQVLSGSPGKGGNITIYTERLTLSDRASISTSTLGEGRAGNLTIRAIESIEVLNGSNLQAVVGPNGKGNGGMLTVEADRILLAEGSHIATTTLEQGDAGELTVTARYVEIRGFRFDDEHRLVPSRLEAQVNPDAIGNGGMLTVKADRLRVLNGARISAATFSSGNAGDVEIAATEIELSGGRELTIALNGGREFVDELPSGVVAGVFGEEEGEGTGNGGTLTVEADRLTIKNGMELSVRSEGLGATGDLNINASELFLDRGVLNATTTQGTEGNITLNISDLRLRNESNITTNATGESTGGDITINTNTLTALENSDITANAEASQGGQVSITTEGLFGTQFRETLTLESDITASSELGPEFSGTVNIQTPDVDPSRGLLELPDTPIDINALIDRNPCRYRQESQFTIPGRGGLPPTPQEPLWGEEGYVEPVKFDASDDRSVSDAIPQSQPTRLVEAQGWIIGDNGEVILTANPPKVNLQGKSSVTLNPTCQ